jgi:hypothetical protein
MKLQSAWLEVVGTLPFAPDLTHWIDNSFRVEFKNQCTG